MLFAIVDGEKTEATPYARGTCPLCNEPVFSKCGEINVWHWAHFKDEDCDSWYEPETEWHKHWKLIFGIHNCEVIIKKNGVRHIADIKTNNDVIIELQNSPIQKQIIRKREDFYGERMLWILNGIQFTHNFRTYSLLSGTNFSMDKHSNRHGIFDNLKEENKPILKNDLGFTWDWARKSWSSVQRYIFIDFGDEDLFWVTNGMGTRNGKGKLVKKKHFLHKYDGNLELLPSIITEPKIH